MLSLLGIGTAIATLARMSVWQNSIRGLMQMLGIESAYPMQVLAISVATAIVVLLIARALIWLGNRTMHRQTGYCLTGFPSLWACFLLLLS